MEDKIMENQVMENQSELTVNVKTRNGKDGIEVEMQVSGIANACLKAVEILTGSFSKMSHHSSIGKVHQKPLADWELDALAEGPDKD